MKLLTFILFIALYSACSQGNQESLKPTLDLENLEVNFATINNNLSFKIMNELLKNPKENIFISPASIHIAMLMTSLGADGETNKEMSKLLYPNIDLERASKSLKQHLKRINSHKNITLKMANSLWLEKTFVLEKKYLRTVENIFSTTLTPLDFVSHHEKSRTIINNWVEKKTNDKIVNLLPKDAISNLTRFVLTNAIYFKGDWDKKFNEKRTHDQVFYGNKKQTSIPFMHLRHKVQYWEDKNVQYVQLLYKGKSVALNLFLPQKNRLDHFTKNFNFQKYKDIIHMRRSEKVNIAFPKFKIDNALPLKEIFKKLGLISPFLENKANFKKMTKRNDLFIGEIFHQTFLEVNEKGSEAAGATAVVMQLKSMARPSHPKQFIMNRPFFITMTDTKTKTILFSGYIQGL